MRTRRGSRLAPRELATTWQLASLLLDYPGADLLRQLPVLRSEAAALPTGVGAPLLRFLDHLSRCDPESLRAEYVETFDLTRKCCLYLTYFTHGDTRKRGLALVQVKQAYRDAGVDFDPDDIGELPDHLCVVLEFGACHDPDTAHRLLTEHRAGLEVLSMALTGRGSPWADVVAAVLATLPPLAGDDQERLRRLIEQGPPSEDVGLDTTPYLLDPRLTPRPTGPKLITTTIGVGVPQ